MDGFHSNTTFVADMSVGIWLTAKDLIWRKFLHFDWRNNESEHLPMGKNANMSVLFVNECSVLELRDAFNMIWEMELEEICICNCIKDRNLSLNWIIFWEFLVQPHFPKVQMQHRVDFGMSRSNWNSNSSKLAENFKWSIYFSRKESTLSHIKKTLNIYIKE